MIDPPYTFIITKKPPTSYGISSFTDFVIFINTNQTVFKLSIILYGDAKERLTKKFTIHACTICQYALTLTICIINISSPQFSSSLSHIFYTVKHDSSTTPPLRPQKSLPEGNKYCSNHIAIYDSMYFNRDKYIQLRLPCT